MSFLFRFSFLALLLGFVSGLLARRALGRQRIPEILLASGIPWAIYLIYVLRRGVILGGFGVDTVLAGLLSIGLAAGLLTLAPRFYRTRPMRAALVPVALAALQGLVILAWTLLVPYSVSTTLAGVGFVLGTLFFSAALWAYALPSARLPRVGELGRRR